MHVGIILNPYLSAIYFSKIDISDKSIFEEFSIKVNLDQLDNGSL